MENNKIADKAHESLNQLSKGKKTIHQVRKKYGLDELPEEVNQYVKYSWLIPQLKALLKIQDMQSTSITILSIVNILLFAIAILVALLK